MPIACSVCNMVLSGPIPYQDHLNGRRHQRNLQTTGSGVTQQPQSQNTSTYRAQNQQLPSHNNRPTRQVQNTHQAQSRRYGARGAASARRGTSRPAPPTRPSAQLSGQSDSNDPPSALPPSSYLIDFGVIPIGSSNPITLEATIHGVEGYSDLAIEPIKESRASSANGFKLVGRNRISPGAVQVRVQFRPDLVRRGVHVVWISRGGDSEEFDESTKLKAIVGSPEDHKDLKRIAPFSKDKRLRGDDWHRQKMLRGKPPASMATPDFRRLGFYDIPNTIRGDLEISSRHGGLPLSDQIRSRLESASDTDPNNQPNDGPYELNIGNYTDYWDALLWHEELEVEQDLKKYDMKRTIVHHVSNLDYSIDVPGLSEKRPSVIVTDLVAMKAPGAARGMIYGGYVIDVQQSSLILRMHPSFGPISDARWDVRFTVNRLLFRRMHDAVNRAEPYERILFPTDSFKLPPTGMRPRTRLDNKVAGNAKQTLVVQRILAQPLGDVPFIIFGPPGTGKTTALVEAIHQVVRADPNHRVLICAPGNAATDLITTRLSKMHGPSELFRLNAPARSYDTLPTDLRRYSLIEDKKFKSPPKDQLEGYRMVASTCYYASVPSALRIEDHFTHIFVDEAGHAAEPEVMVAVLTNAGPKTNVILCGDPMQLGPIVQSKVCDALGMGTSYLDRLMKLSLYAAPQDASHPNIVKLLDNYRNHPDILRFSNIAFYENELQCCADPVITRSLGRFSELPRPDFPIIFHSICGENMREAKSPSYFNIDEATLVAQYVDRLLSDRKLRLNGQDIGVIVPYRQQCVKIRQLLKKKGYGGVEVKVTEDWQGQERRVIIASTTRCDPEIRETNAPECLGFVANWRRTNVTLTRAQALMIIIGNRTTLELDPTWYFFMHYAHAAGAWEGDPTGYAPTLTANPFIGTPIHTEAYQGFGPERWSALMEAGGAERDHIYG